MGRTMCAHSEWQGFHDARHKGCSLHHATYAYLPPRWVNVVQDACILDGSFKLAARQGLAQSQRLALQICVGKHFLDDFNQRNRPELGGLV
jgi:hypothetical protein